MPIRPGASNELAVPAQQRLRLDRKASRPAAAASGSAPPTARDPLVSASAAQPAGAGSPAHGGEQGFPPPSSDATARATTPARTGSARRDTRTTTASKQPSLHLDKSDEPNGPDAATSRGEVCEPYAVSWRFSCCPPSRRSTARSLSNSTMAEAAWFTATSRLTSSQRLTRIRAPATFPSLYSRKPEEAINEATPSDLHGGFGGRGS
jgi:hypothetical protein